VNKRQWRSQWELRLSSPNPSGQRGSSRPTPPFGERPHSLVDWIWLWFIIYIYKWHIAYTNVTASAELGCYSFISPFLDNKYFKHFI